MKPQTDLALNLFLLAVVSFWLGMISMIAFEMASYPYIQLDSPGVALIALVYVLSTASIFWIVRDVREDMRQIAQEGKK